MAKLRLNGTEVDIACPKCGSGDVRIGHMRIEGGKVSAQGIRCLQCDCTEESLIGRAALRERE